MKKPMKKPMNDLVFEPLVSFDHAGASTQRCRAQYKTTSIMWETYFPWYGEPRDKFIVDIIVKASEIILNGILADYLYTDEGFGYPEFGRLDDAIAWIDNFLDV